MREKRCMMNDLVFCSLRNFKFTVIHMVAWMHFVAFLNIVFLFQNNIVGSVESAHLFSCTSITRNGEFYFLSPPHPSSPRPVPKSTCGVAAACYGDQQTRKPSKVYFEKQRQWPRIDDSHAKLRVSLICLTWFWNLGLKINDILKRIEKTKTKCHL